MCLIFLFFLPVFSVSPVRGETPIQVGHSSVFCHEGAHNMHIICDFQWKSAQLGIVDSLFNSSNPPADHAETLHLEISNCSSLVISPLFQCSWKRKLIALNLRLNNIGDVIQEESDDCNVTSRFVKLSMENCTASVLRPNLISDTSSLMIDLSNCSIGIISASTFKNVGQLWQFLLSGCTVDRFETNSMPDPMRMSPFNPDIAWPIPSTMIRFIFNETRIGEIRENAMQFHFHEKDDWLKIVNCHIGRIERSGLQITGAGHVLIARSNIDYMEKDSLNISLQSNETRLQDLKSLTLNLMDVKLANVDVTNFLNNLRVPEGKVYLIRMTFPFAGALQSVINDPYIWNNQSVHVEEVAVVCDCRQLAEFNGIAEGQGQPSTSEGPQSRNSDYGRNRPGNAGDDSQTRLDLAAGSQIREELRCYLPNDGIVVNVSNFLQDDRICPTKPTRLDSSGDEQLQAKGDAAHPASPTEPTQLKNSSDEQLKAKDDSAHSESGTVLEESDAAHVEGPTEPTQLNNSVHVQPLEGDTVHSESPTEPTQSKDSVDEQLHNKDDPAHSERDADHVEGSTEPTQLNSSVYAQLSENDTARSASPTEKTKLKNSDDQLLGARDESALSENDIAPTEPTRLNNSSDEQFNAGNVHVKGPTQSTQLNSSDDGQLGAEVESTHSEGGITHTEDAAEPARSNNPSDEQPHDEDAAEPTQFNSSDDEQIHAQDDTANFEDDIVRVEDPTDPTRFNNSGDEQLHTKRPTAHSEAGTNWVPIFFTILATCVVVGILVMTIRIQRRRGVFSLNRQRIEFNRKNRGKVGVISEEPICEEDCEEEF